MDAHLLTTEERSRWREAQRLVEDGTFGQDGLTARLVAIIGRIATPEISTGQAQWTNDYTPIKPIGMTTDATGRRWEIPSEGASRVWETDWGMKMRGTDPVTEMRAYLVEAHERVRQAEVKTEQAEALAVKADERIAILEKDNRTLEVDRDKQARLARAYTVQAEEARRLLHRLLAAVNKWRSSGQTGTLSIASDEARKLLGEDPLVYAAVSQSRTASAYNGIIERCAQAATDPSMAMGRTAVGEAVRKLKVTDPNEKVDNLMWLDHLMTRPLTAWPERSEMRDNPNAAKELAQALRGYIAIRPTYDSDNRVGTFVRANFDLIEQALKAYGQTDDVITDFERRITRLEMHTGANAHD